MGNRTGRIAVLGTLLTAGALCLASSAQAATLVASTQSATAGTQVTISVTLQTQGAMIAGTQNDLAFDATNIPVARHCTKSANAQITCSVDADCPAGDTCSLKPACYVNPDIDKGATSFAYRGAPGCTGPACGGLRALVLSTGNVDPIADGSVLYTCKVNVAAAATGSFPLTLSGIIASDPDGQPVTSTGVNGAINLGTVDNTPTPTTGGGGTPTPTTPPLECLAPALQFDTVSANPNTQATISLTLLAGTAMVAGTQNDFTFDPTNIPVPRHCTKSANVQITCSADADCPAGDTCSTKPACYVNPDIDKGATSFAYRGAPGCTGPACGGIRALVLSTGNVDPIPTGSVLYTCKVNVAASASGSFPLALSGIILSDPDGQPVTGATGCNGAVTTGVIQNTPTPTTGGGDNTPTATATRTATPTVPTVIATNTPTRTNTPVPPTATATRTNTPVSVPTVPFFDDDGGCNISTAGSNSSGWLVLIPAIGLLVLRRRRR